MFVVDGQTTPYAVASMPGVDLLSRRPGGARCRARGETEHPLHRAVPLHRALAARRTGVRGAEPDNLVCQSVRAIKKEFPDLGVLCDVASIPSPATAMTG
jgi:porphobilinogen synthase